MGWFSKEDEAIVGKPKSGFADGLRSFLNDYANRRNATNTNAFLVARKTHQELREVFKTGVASKIFRIKTGHALRNALVFQSEEDEDLYNARLAALVKKAAMYQLGFGRGIIVALEQGGDLSKPLPAKRNPARTTLKCFAADMVSSQEVDYNLLSSRYYKPIFYAVRGTQIHWTRVADFTYYEPTEEELSQYDYGGISESQLIYAQLVNDSVVERASASIIEKNATIFYKVSEFKSRLAQKQEKPLLEYFKRLEDARSMYGAGLLDAEDDVVSVAQTLTNLSEVHDISLRRLAMVTGIPLPMLVGENVKGLNSSGETERQTFQDTIQAYQQDYLQCPLSTACAFIGIDKVKFKEAHGMSALELVKFEQQVIDNAFKLAQMGGDYQEYMREHGVTKNDPFKDLMDDGDFTGSE